MSSQLIIRSDVKHSEAYLSRELYLLYEELELELFNILFKDSQPTTTNI